MAHQRLWPESSSPLNTRNHAKGTWFPNSSLCLSGEHRFQHICLSRLASFGVFSGQILLVTRAGPDREAENEMVSWPTRVSHKRAVGTTLRPSGCPPWTARRICSCSWDRRSGPFDGADRVLPNRAPSRRGKANSPFPSVKLVRCSRASTASSILSVLGFMTAF